MAPNSQQFGAGGYHFVDHLNGHAISDYGKRVDTRYKKSERSMLAKTLLWLFWPAIITGWFAILHWINWNSPLEGVTAIVTLIVGISKGIIMWAEKGHVVYRRINNFFAKRRKKKKKLFIDETENYLKD